jgi:hypothetical protein
MRDIIRKHVAKRGEFFSRAQSKETAQPMKKKRVAIDKSIFGLRSNNCRAGVGATTPYRELAPRFEANPEWWAAVPSHA